MGEVSYRKLNPSESKIYRNLRLESLKAFPNSFGSNFEDQQQKEKLAFEKYIEESNPASFVFGSFIDEKLIGICAFYMLKEDGGKHRGEIIQMYVKPEYQNNKFGYNLVKAIILEAFKIEDLKQIELQVIADLIQANKVYEKLGFKEFDLQRKFDKKRNVYSDQRSMVLYRDDLC